MTTTGTHHRGQEMTNRHIARRTLLTRTGLGVGAAFSAGLSAGLGSGIAPAKAKDTLGDHVWSQGYWAQKGDLKLAMYRKWLPGAADKPPPVLFLVHGSSLSARSSFDLNVPNGGDYSIMDA